MKRMPYLLMTAAMLVSCTEKQVDVTVSIVPQPVSVLQTEGSGTYRNTVTDVDSALGKEEYVLVVKNGKANITGGSEAGIFYGEQTLSQIRKQCGDGEIPNLRIEDRPQFTYRGAHLDCSRTFYSVDEVKCFLDIMAVHKLNTFHWHLTDDQGWRFESKKYPKLTEIGGWRDGTMVGENLDVDNGIRHGGYYTQEQMKEIVAYAAERAITIIPEIEMPGHSVAALVSYPELGCTGGPYTMEKKLLIVCPDVLCVGNDNTMQFLKDILDEVCEIFPGEYVHIGGDESPRTRWQTCPRCQARMKSEDLENEAQLQSWLNREVESYLKTKGKKIIGWDEILEGGVTETATIMSWRGTEGGKAAAKKGNDAVMCPHTHFYFDYWQTEGKSANNEPRSFGMPINIRKIYSYDPFEGIEEADRHHIRGVQANMWSEYTFTFGNVMFQELPRISAVAEIAWNADGRTGYDDFISRVRTSLLPIYEERGWTYADYAFRYPPVE